MSIVSNNIKYLRRLNGLTQEQFARKIGIKRSLLGAYEEARANPNLLNLKNIANSFGITVDSLLKQDLRKIRETPSIVFQGTEVSSGTPAPSSPLLPDKPSPPPVELGVLLEKMPLPKPSELRTVARPITLQPLRGRFVSPRAGSLHTAENIRALSETPPVAGGSATSSRVQWVASVQMTAYLQQRDNAYFLQNLPTFSLPQLPAGNYRAFESGTDFAFPGALLVGSYVKNWFEIRDGAHYILIVKHQGALYRRVYNQSKTKGTLLATSDKASVPTTEIGLDQIVEIWEVKGFFSKQLPEPPPDLSRMKQLAEELSKEVTRISP